MLLSNPQCVDKACRHSSNTQCFAGTAANINRRTACFGSQLRHRPTGRGRAFSAKQAAGVLLALTSKLADPPLGTSDAENFGERGPCFLEQTCKNNHCFYVLNTLQTRCFRWERTVARLSSQNTPSAFQSNTDLSFYEQGINCNLCVISA